MKVSSFIKATESNKPHVIYSVGFSQRCKCCNTLTGGKFSTHSEVSTKNIGK